MKKIIFLISSSIICFILAGYSYGLFPSASSTPSNPSQKNEQKEKPAADSASSESEKAEFTLLKAEVKKLVEAQKREAAHMKGITPSTIEIPAIGVKANIEQVGILENGQMGVPEEINNVGWFEPGVKPGGKGSAVLAGHVDSKTGPAIFFDLNKLKQGDEIIVKDQDGTALTFTVKKQESYGRTSAPIEDIFQTSEGQNLNLITCSGTFNREEGTHEERLVVFAELKAEKEIEKEEPPQAPENVKITGTFVTWHAVRKETIVGYRIYRGDKDGGEFKQVGSISVHERKSFTDNEAEKYAYYITAVDAFGQESEPSEIAGAK